MTDPAAQDPGYLEEAAAELRKARDANGKRRELAAELATYRRDTEAIDREVAARSMELAEGFTRLAAIEQGLPPCCHHVRPDQEPQP